MLDSVSDALEIQVEDGVLVLTLNRPEARNALSPRLIDDLTTTLEWFCTNGDLRAAVVTGRGPAFCSGVDRKHFSAADADRSRPKALLRRIGALPKPLIGAINGPAVAGGFELALGCDFLIGTSGASFADAHLDIGAFPSGGITARLPRVVGVGVAKAVVLAGLRINAEEALRLGLLARTVDPADLLPAAMQLAAKAAGHDAELVHAVRDLLQNAPDIPLPAAIHAEDDALSSWRATGRTAWKPLS